MHKLLFFIVFFSGVIPASGQDLVMRDSVLVDPDTLSLTELCDIYKTDKCADDHNYIVHYENLFTPLRDSVERILEIGILHGASHRMWATYFDQAEVYGIDIEEHRLINTDRIHSMVADQSDRAALSDFTEQFPGDFEIVIDDGGHTMEQQQVSFAYFFPYIESGGYFIIEDVHTSLPDYYPPQYFGVNEEETNTTLKMLEDYIRTAVIQSEYLTDKERVYLQSHIDSIQLIFRNNRRHSVMCVIQKK